MRGSIGFGLCLALALSACGKPATKQAVAAPDAPQVRIAQVGGTAFAPTVSAGGTVATRPTVATPGRAAPVLPGASQPSEGYDLHVQMPTGDAARVTLGATVQVTFPAFENDVIVGRVTSIAAPADGTAAMEIALPRDGRLRTGQEGRARIVANGAATTVLAVPPSAVVGLHGGAPAVLVVDLATSLVHRRAVTLGAQSPDGIGVTSGLHKGEWVALTRADQLNDGEKIAPVGPSQ